MIVQTMYFFALSHGVHRGSLKYGGSDEREKFINKLISISKDIKYDIFGLDNVQPIWADQYFKHFKFKNGSKFKLEGVL